MDYDGRYVRGVELFNAGEFFECHDELEDLWTETLGEEREFYQGLIHAAVALHHFETGNLGGARKMHDSARNYLDPYRPRHLGVDLEAFLSQLRHCFRHLLGAHDSYPSGVEIDPTDIPQLHVAGID